MWGVLSVFDIYRVWFLSSAITVSCLRKNVLMSASQLIEYPSMLLEGVKKSNNVSNITHSFVLCESASSTQNVNAK